MTCNVFLAAVRRVEDITHGFSTFEYLTPRDQCVAQTVMIVPAPCSAAVPSRLPAV